MTTIRTIWIAFCLQLICGPSFSTEAVAADAPKQFRLLFNSDNGTPVFYRYDAPMSPDQLCTVINQLKGTQVDVFMACPQFSDDQFWYPTAVGEIYDGRQVKDGKFDDANFKRVAGNVKSLFERGIDPMHVWATRAHELGMQFWPTLRMNDIHKDWVDLWPSLRSQWELARPHVHIGKDFPRRYALRAGKPYSYAWDYRHKEVRERKLALIAEMCTNYDVDGFDLDFQSHPYYFKAGKEQEGMPAMTAFVRNVRALLDEIGKKKNKRLVLSVRVPSSFKSCDEVGLDVRSWIRETLVDVVTPMERGYLDMDANVQEFAEAARGTNCQIAGGLEHYVRLYAEKNRNRSSIEMMRAAASCYYAQGATGMYLFNFDAHAWSVPFRADEQQTLKEIGDPRQIAGKDKHYYVTRDMEALTADQEGNKQLPALLKPDQTRMFSFHVGDNLSSAKKKEVLKSLQLQLTTNGLKASRQSLKFQLNGETIEPTDFPKSPLTFKNVPVKQGRNKLILSRSKSNDSQRTPLRIEGIELFIHYKQ